MESSDRQKSKSSFDRLRIAVILTGGTIQTAGKDRLDFTPDSQNEYRLSADELLSRMPELADLAQLESIQYSTGPSTLLGETDWLNLLRLVQSLLENDRADGVVIAHGTNTLEETAYFLHLTLKTTAPVVLVGAMRPARAMSGDGDLNLVNAVRTACMPSAARLGVLVVLNDTIYSARDVTKTSTYRLDAFSGRDLGPLGFADNDRKVVIYHRPARPHTFETEFDLQNSSSLPPVQILLSYVGVDHTLIDAAVAAGIPGIVIAGSGAGDVTPAQDEALARARNQNVSVCLSSRTGSGRVVQRREFAARGIVAADNLVPWKARILLSLALTRTNHPEQIQAIFDRY
jgi:L-asparaginase